MLNLASQLPEFPVVMAMRGVGKSLGPQLMAEIGDVTRFAHRSAITSFAGVDPGANQSGTYEDKSVRTSKSGPPELRRTLFLVMDSLIQTKPQDDPVYQFMDKKRAEGKPYLQNGTSVAALLLCPFTSPHFSSLFCKLPLDFIFADFLCLQRPIFEVATRFFAHKLVSKSTFFRNDLPYH